MDFESSNKLLTLSATSKGRLDISKTKNINIEIQKESHLFLRRGDILIQRGNSRELVGISALVTKDSNTIIYPDLMMKIVCGESILPEFLHLCLLSTRSRNFMWNRLTGTSSTMPKKINKKTVESILIPQSTLDEQARTVDKASALIKLCCKYENQLTNAWQIAERLSKAAVAAITGIHIKYKETMKAPKTELVSKLKLKTNPSKKDQAPLAAILAKHNGELPAKGLWSYSGLAIDGFCQQLKTEMARSWIDEPEKARALEMAASSDSAEVA